MRRLLLAITVLLLVPASAEAALETFRSPSGKIGCMYYDDADIPAHVRCDWRGGGDHAVVVEETGKGKRVRVTDTVMDPGARVLRYGQKRRFGPFTCRSRRSGITCRNAARHGFTVSVERRKVF